MEASFESERFESERDELQRLLARQLEELIAEAGPLDEVAGLQQIGSQLATRLGQDEEVLELFSDALVERGDAKARLLLEAARAFASGQVAARLDKARGRLDAAGAEPSRLPMDFADLHVSRVLRARSQVADNYLVWIRRAGDGEKVLLASLIVLTLDQGPDRGPLIDGTLSLPLDAAGAEQELEAAVAKGEAGGIDLEEIPASELASALQTACAENRRQEWEVEFELGAALSLLAVALRDDPGAFGEVRVREPPRGLLAGRNDPVGFKEMADALLDEFLEWVDQSGAIDGPRGRSGHLIAGSMLEWKWREGDGFLGHWTGDAVGEFLLDYVPREVTTNAQIEADAADCMAGFLSFLAERELLQGDPLDRLIECCAELRDDFLDIATEREKWAPAKRLAMQMQAEGVDPFDSDAVQVWIDEFNTRSTAERDAIIGPSLGDAAARTRTSRSGSHSSAKRKSARRAQRKAARQARRRSRR